MAQITLNATKRAVTGKPVKKLRKAGKIPAVLYGHNVTTESLELSEGDFRKVFKKAGESTIITLDVDGKSTPVLIHDVHNHYLTEQPIHVDFYAVNMTEKLTATIPLHFEGESAAVKTLGGVLAKNLTELEVECLPIDLPQFIVIDISALVTFADSIRVADVKVSDKVEIKAAPEEVIISATPPRTEEEIKELDEKPVEADVTAVEGVVKPTDVVTDGADGDKDKDKDKGKKE